MSIRNSWIILSREASTGLRSVMSLWIILFPLLITFIIRLVFGGLIDPQPRLGIVDLGSSTIPAAVAQLEEIDSVVLDSVEELQLQVESNDLDAGLILQEGFDEMVIAGELPEFRFFVGGESLSSTRIVLAVTSVELIRSLAGEPAPVEVVVDLIGDAPSVPIVDRLVPMLVLLAVAFAGIFLPAASLIQEKVNKTADAVLSTPVQVGEFLLAKGAIGFVLSLGVGILTLLLNGGFSTYVAGNIAAITVGALMSVAIGLLTGCAIRNIQTMFAVWKSGGIILFAPAVLFLFPGVPGWIARLFPTYYFLGPLYEMTVNAASFSTVYIDLLIGIAISIVLFIFLSPVAKRMEMKLATA